LNGELFFAFLQPVLILSKSPARPLAQCAGKKQLQYEEKMFFICGKNNTYYFNKQIG
jgi:hypothetical protein